MGFSSLLPFQKKQASPLLLVADIGDLRMKFAAIRPQGNRFEVLALSSVPTDMLHWKQSFERARSTATDQFGNPDIVLASLPPSVFRAKMAEYTVREEKSTRMNKKEAAEMEQDLQKKAREDISQHFAEVLGIAPGELEIPNLLVLERKANGYPVSGFAGLSAEEFKTRYLATCIPSRYQASSLGQNARLVHEAEGFARFARQTNKTCVLLDVGERVTQMCLARQGRMEAFQEVKKGASVFDDAIEQQLGMQDASARDLKERYIQGEFSDSMRTKLKNVLLPAADAWSTMCVETLLSGERVVGSHIFLAGGGAHLPELRERLKARLRSIVGERIELSVLVPRDLAGHDKFPGADNPLYTPLFLLPYAIS